MIIIMFIINDTYMPAHLWARAWLSFLNAIILAICYPPLK